MRVGWYNDNRERAYPFVYSADSTLPTQVIVDFGSVVGLSANYGEDDSMYLHAIRLNAGGTELEFEFKSTATGLADLSLLFHRDVDAELYTTEFSEISTSEASDGECLDGDIIWEGFLVTGDLAPILDLLDPEDEIVYTEDSVEPALIQNLADSSVRSVTPANAARVQATAPAGCRELCSETEQDIYIVEACLTGSLRFAPGHNIAIRQTDTGLVFSAAVGAGLGEPCEELPIGDVLSSPGPLEIEGEDLELEEEISEVTDGPYMGGPKCDEVLRSFNGSGGRIFTIQAGVGSRITPDGDMNRLLISLDMNGLAVCYETSDSSDAFAPLDESSDSCECGPE